MEGSAGGSRHPCRAGTYGGFGACRRHGSYFVWHVDAAASPGTLLRDFPFSPFFQSQVNEVPVRQLSLNEVAEVTSTGGKRFVPLLGTFQPGVGPIVKRYSERVTEIVKDGTTELWEIINFSPDPFPIHLHLGQFRIINRQEFVLDTNHQIVLIGEPMPAKPSEDGPKDIVPVRDKLFSSFLWYFHILSHEDNEMMRKYLGSPSAKTIYFAIHKPVLMEYELPAADKMGVPACQPGFLQQSTFFRFTPSQDATIQSESLFFRIRCGYRDGAGQVTLLVGEYVWQVTSWKKGHAQRTTDIAFLCNEVLDYQRSSNKQVDSPREDKASLSFVVEFTLVSLSTSVTGLEASNTCPGHRCPQVLTRVLDTRQHLVDGPERAIQHQSDIAIQTHAPMPKSAARAARETISTRSMDYTCYAKTVADPWISFSNNNNNNDNINNV
eukprot:g28519.t1